MKVYLIELEPTKTFKHHIEIIKSYFPNLQLYDNYTIVIPSIDVDHLPIRFEEISCEDCPCDDLINFVNGDENDIFALKDLILKKSWYKLVYVS